MKLLSLLVAVGYVNLSSLADAAQPAGTACTQPRIRKPWEAYSQAEKTTYLNAIKLAMQQGYHQKFVELHTETTSEAEAHRNCMFMYWHRMFLLGYENMLRSLGDEYKCVTLPYWDHLSATARAASKKCIYIQDCSPIYNDFGGSTVGVDRNMRIYDTTITDTPSTKCVTQPPVSSFCGNVTASVPKACCILRGPVSRTRYPAEATFASVYQQVFTYSDWPGFATSVERGVHNMVHSVLGGIMTYFQSPIDPVFYTHHGVIDLLQAIYLKCQLGDETTVLTSDQKGSDPRVWNNCPRRSGVPYTNADTVTMMTRDYSGKWVHVRNNPNNILYPFFKDLPAKFSDYVDAKDLGVYSYTYQMQGALGNMYRNCKASNTISAAVLLDDEDLGRNHQTGKELLPIIDGPTATDTRFRLWTIAVYESAKLAGYTDEAARDQMELMLCVHSDECLGGVIDYDETFRANFGATGHPRCFTLLNQLQCGKKIIGVPEWHDISSKFLPCPYPKRDKNGKLHHHRADDDGNGDDDDDDVVYGDSADQKQAFEFLSASAVDRK